MRPRAALPLLLAACAAASAPVPAASPAPPAEPVPADSPALSAPVPADSPAPAPVPEDSPSAPVPAVRSPRSEHVPADSSSAPVPADSPPPADPPVLTLLGRPRKEIEARLGPPRAVQDGWTRHATVDLQYRGDRCVRVRRTAPATLDCAAVPLWAGIPDPVGFPLRRAATCAWPGLSERHKLADGLAATHDLATHTFEVWLRD